MGTTAVPILIREVVCEAAAMMVRASGRSLPAVSHTVSTPACSAMLIKSRVLEVSSGWTTMPMAVPLVEEEGISPDYL
jgi:hypothetical protein